MRRKEVLVIGHADSELRDSEVAMRLQVSDGTSQEKFLYLCERLKRKQGITGRASASLRFWTVA